MSEMAFSIENYESDGDFVPAYRCEGKVNLTPVPSFADLVSSTHVERNKEISGMPSAKATSAFPQTSFGNVPERAISLSERVAIKAGLDEDRVEIIKKTPFEQLRTDYESLGLNKNELQKIRSTMQEELLSKWQPGSLVNGLGARGSFGAAGDAGQDAQLLKVCYFLQNLDVQLLTMRQEATEIAKIIAEARDEGSARQEGYDDFVNALRVRLLANQGQISSEKLKLSLQGIVREIETCQSFSYRLRLHAKASLKYTLIIGTSLSAGFVLGRHFLLKA
ncbi:unnamed protein product, partial [Mesorhabditis spiculigera]